MNGAKNLIFIHGPAGIGKSTACALLHSRLPRSAWLESEWCGKTNPFDWSPEKQALVERNMSFLLRSYLECSILDHVILNWGLHSPRKQILGRVLDHLRDLEYRCVPIILLCSETEQVRRMKADSRSEIRIQRSLGTRCLYEDKHAHTIDTTDLTVEDTVDRILELLNSPA